MSKECIIYSLEYPEGNVRYIGKTTMDLKVRFRGHLVGRNSAKTHKNNWIKKLFKEGVKPIVHQIDVVPEEEWRFWERFWISQMKTWGFKLTNTTEGGDGLSGYSHKESTKAKQSTGRYKYLEQAEKKSWNEGMKGFESEETKNKRSNSLMGHVVTEEQIEKGRNTKIERGICQSKEEKIAKRKEVEIKMEQDFIERCYKIHKIDISSLEIVATMDVAQLKENYDLDEVRNIRGSCLSSKINNKFRSYLNYFWSYEGVDFSNFKRPHEDSKRKRKVDQFDLEDNFIKTWNLMSEAEEFYNKRSSTNIVANCRGNQKSAYGYKWRYHG